MCERHGVGRVWLFGSSARNEARPDSDIDLLVERTGPRTPWWPGGLVADLEDLLGRRVDVVSVGALKGDIGTEVRREAIQL